MLPGIHTDFTIMRLSFKMKKMMGCWIPLLCMGTALAQNNVGIGTSQPNPNAVLELVSPGDNQGLLIPSMTTSQRTATSFVENLSETDNGLLVFDMEEKTFYYWSDSAWMPIGGNTVAGGDLTGTYPDPEIREKAVSETKLSDNAVTSDKIADGTIRENDFLSPGAGKVLTTTGSGQVFWDNQSIFGLSFLEQGRVYVGNSGNRPEAVDLRGIGNILVGNGTTAAPVAVNGDLTLNSAGNAQIVPGAVGADEVQDNSLTNLDINETAAIVGTKINPIFGAQNISTTGNLTVQDIGANGNVSILGKATAAMTTDADIATTLTTKGYLEAKIDAASLNLEEGNGIADFMYNGQATATVTVNNGAGLDFAADGALQIADEGVMADKLNADVAGRGMLKNTGSGALELDIDGIPAAGEAAEDGDFLAIYDVSAANIYKISRADWLNNASLNADNITGGTLADTHLPDAGPGAQTYTAISSIEIDAKGRVVTVGGTPSDIRLKKEIVPLSGVLAQLMTLQGYHYRWKEPQKDTTLQIGLIAQELEKVYPELVATRSDQFKSVNYLGMIPLLLEAIKEQQTTIQALQEQVSQLKAGDRSQQLEELQQENKEIRAALDVIKAALELKSESATSDTPTQTKQNGERR